MLIMLDKNRNVPPNIPVHNNVQEIFANIIPIYYYITSGSWAISRFPNFTLVRIFSQYWEMDPVSCGFFKEKPKSWKYWI